MKKEQKKRDTENFDMMTLYKEFGFTSHHDMDGGRLSKYNYFCAKDEESAL